MTEIKLGFVSVNIFAPIAWALMWYAEGSEAFCVIMAAALIHEAGHVIAVYSLGSSVTHISLLPAGAVISYREGLLSYGEDAVTAMSGPLVNLGAAAVAGAVMGLAPGIYVLLFLFANLFFALINLIPMRGNDGCRVISALLLRDKDPDEAESIMKKVSFAGGIMCASIGFICAAASGFAPCVAALMLFAAIPTQNSIEKKGIV